MPAPICERVSPFRPDAIPRACVMKRNSLLLSLARSLSHTRSLSLYPRNMMQPIHFEVVFVLVDCKCGATQD